MGADVKVDRRREGGGAAMVALGILLSRLTGLVRQRVFAHFFGSSAAADAVTAAFRIPNLLQNMFGEGALSASFIPVYAGLLGKGEKREADRVAGAVFALLAVCMSLAVLVGVAATPLIIDAIAPGFTGDKRALTVQLVRIFFPGAALLALSAWCLGVLNSHRRFLLSYASTAVGNIVMIAVLIAGALLQPDRGTHLAVIYAWGSVLASLIIFLVQLPPVLRLAPELKVRLDRHSADVQTVVRNFGPVFISRGVVQLSAYIDQFLASWLPGGSVALLFYAQNLSILPVSLFGMAVSAAELPTMSSVVGDADQVATYLRGRLSAGLARIAFFIVPSAMAFLALGNVLAGALFRTGRFTQTDTLWVWTILAGSAVGLLASTLGRLYASTYYALRDTRTPLRFALVRVTLTTVLGVLFAFALPRWLGIDHRWGMAGLTSSAGIAGWVEFLLLRRTLNARIGATGLSASLVARLWVAAALAAVAAYGVEWLIPPGHAIVLAAATLPVYGAVYLALSAAFGVGEVKDLGRRIKRYI